MRGLLLLSVVALMLAGWATTSLPSDPGYLFLDWGEYTVEMKPTVGIALTLVIFMLLGLVFVTLFRLGRSVSASTQAGPRKVGQWRGRHGQRADHRRTNKAQMAFVEGKWESARQLLGKVHIARIAAWATPLASLLGIHWACNSMDFRSTSVSTAPCCCAPKIRSASQSP